MQTITLTLNLDDFEILLGAVEDMTNLASSMTDSDEDDSHHRSLARVGRMLRRAEQEQVHTH